MRAFQVTDHDSPPTLRSVNCPQPGNDQVLVRIAACGLNFADLLTAKGTYQDIPPLPATLGIELAGTVEATGPGVDGIGPGQRVAAYGTHGGLAEFGVFDADSILPIPESMPFEVAAGFAVAYGTSHLALTRRARLAEGERLVVLGAAGGVGLTAVEVGAALGAEVVAVARGADKLRIAERAGAHHLVDSEEADLRRALLDLGGVDVIYDSVGGELTIPALRACRPEGRLLVVGFASGEVPKLAANHLLVKNVDVIGFYWGGYRSFARAALTGSLSDLLAMYEAGRLRPHVSETFPLSRAAEAMDFLASRRSTGKVVVTMAS